VCLCRTNCAAASLEPTCSFNPHRNAHPNTHHAQQLRLGDYATIKLVNFIRAEVAAGRDPRPALQAAAATAGSTEQQPWGDDSYLQPVLPDDPLLTYEYDDDDDEVEPAGCEGQAAAAR
jgi:hypothetical protein